MSDKITTPKGTELPLISLKGKPYLQVAHRLVWFREERPNWAIRTDVKSSETSAITKAEIYDDNDRLIATAHKVEHKQHFADYVEKSETGAIGRALALCGYGTQFAPEIEEVDRLADAPVEPARKPDKASDKQINFIKGLLAELGKERTEKTDEYLAGLDQATASNMIRKLTAEKEALEKKQETEEQDLTDWINEELKEVD